MVAYAIAKNLQWFTKVVFGIHSVFLEVANGVHGTG